MSCCIYLKRLAKDKVLRSFKISIYFAWNDPLVILLSLIGISCFFYAKILRDRKVGDVLIATDVSKDNIEVNNLEVKTSEFGGIWTGQHANSVEENRWKNSQSTKSKKRSFNKVDVFVIEASHKNTF